MSSVMRALGLAVLVGCGAPAPIEQTGAGSGSHTAEATSTATSTTPAASTPTDAPDASSQSASTPSRVEARTFSSAALGVDKTYWVYLPRGYDGSSQRFPVVYMLHGLGGSERNWLDHGALKEAADALALHTIVVMPDGDASFYVDGPPRDSYETCLGKKPDGNKAEAPQTFCVKTPRYETYMTKDLVADVDGHYRTLAKRESRGIGGLSMGGFGALMLSMRHVDLYSAAASHSGLVALTYVGPHPWKQGAEQLAGTASEWGAGYPASLTDVVRRVFGGDIARYRAHDPAVLATKLDPNALAIYLDCGEDDDFKFDDQARYLDGVLDARGVDHTFEIAPGHHLFDFWKARLPRSLAFFDAKLARR